MKWLCICLFGLATMLAVVNPAAAQQPSARPMPPGVKALRDLPYVENGHEPNRLDLYLPEKADGKLPVVVWIHGGGWLNGSKDNCPAVWLTTKGYAVASINYRLSKDAVFPAQNRGLQSGHPLAAGQCGQVPFGPGPHWRVGRVGRRAPGGHARHNRRREGA